MAIIPGLLGIAVFVLLTFRNPMKCAPYDDRDAWAFIIGGMGIGYLISSLVSH
jgi:hypothetical protein